MIITVIVNLRQIKNVVKTSNLTVLKSWKCLKVKQMTVALQWINFSVILILSVILTTSFKASCDAFRVFVEEKIDKKLNVDLTRLRGETIDERFVDDPFFWRYTRRVTNSFGAEMFSTVTSCRLMMTDPKIVTILHDNHADKFAGKPDAQCPVLSLSYDCSSFFQGYYGYWYGEDVFPLDPSFEAVRTSTLMEVSLAASWLATLIWLSLGIYIIIVKRRTESNSSGF